MFKIRVLARLFFILCFVLPLQIFSQNNSASFSFSLNNSANTSAGVFKTDGTLIRTLWGNKKYDAGNYTFYWDGKDDADKYVTDGNYNVKVTSNNLQTQWAVIGNTSTYSTGSTVHNYSGVIKSMVFNGSYAYFTTGYNERQSSYFKFLLSDPQKKIEIISDASAAVEIVATDGIRTYHGGLFGGATQGIFATEVSNDAYSTFSSGVALQAYNAHSYSSVIDVTSTTLPGDPNDPSNPTLAPSYGGMAVQRTGNYLFVSYVDNNQLHVLNKTTGALVRTITTFTPPRSLAFDGNNNLWMVSGTNTVARYTVNSDGTLSAATLTLSGLVKPLSLSVSPDNTTIAVADGGNRQQVRFFNTTTGAEGTPLGQLGGYVNSPDVANDKFMFKNLKQLERDEATFVSYAPDGSFWLGDQGNLRSLHFAANKTYIEKVQSIGYLYSVFADRNNPSRVFANYLEFNVDWTKPFNVTDGSNGLWTQTKNWGYNVTYFYDNQFFRMKGVTTLSNGRTYCMLQHRGTNTSKWNIAELTSTGLRFGVEPNTNNSANDLSYGFNDDGSLLYVDNTNDGTPTKWYKKSLISFDASGNPQWAAPQQIASILTTTSTDPINSAWSNENLITSSGKIAMIHNEASNNGYHIGIVPLGATNWSAQTARETFSAYQGEFPDDGTYDVGNGVHFTGGSLAMVADNIIIQGYRGEFWKATQTNKWNMFSDDGLFLKQFGSTGPEALRSSVEAGAMMAGSMYSGTFMKLPSGDFALVHNDESITWHGAAHIWKITGINTIQTQTIPITKSGTPALPPADYIDLLADIPYRGTLTNGTGKWTTSFDGSGQNILTDNVVYKQGERSLLIHSDGQNRWVKGNLGTINAPNWKITCDMSYPEGQEPGDNFFDILDLNGKLILRISRPRTTFPNIAIKANNATIAAGDPIVLGQVPKPLSISISGSVITVNYGSYATVTTGVFDPSADITKPKTIMFSTNSSPAAHQITISNLRLYTNVSTITTTPDAPTLVADDVANTLNASSNLGTSEIVVSENGGAFVAYAGQINVGNVARAAGYWKFKIKAATLRNESAVVNSPAFTAITTISTPDAPTLAADDVANTLVASNTLGTSEIVLSENGGAFVAYAGQINVGNVARAAGYWKFKIKAATLRTESAVAISPAFTAISTPAATMGTSTCTPPQFLNNGTIVLDATCGKNDGNISIIPTSGVAPFMYSKDGGVTYFTGPNPGSGFMNLGAGTYKLRLKDANGCESAIVERTVKSINCPVSVVPVPPFSTTSASVICTPPQFVNNGSIVLDASCANNDGNISIIPTSGAAPFMYSKDGGITYVSGSNTGSGFMNLASGTYKLRLKDAMGCESAVVEKTVKIVYGYPCTEPPVMSVASALAATVPTSPLAIEGELVKAYPNPNRGQFKVQLLNFKKGLAEVSIVDGKGSVIKKSQINVADNNTIDFNLTGQTPGMYYVKITGMTATKTYKILIQ